MKYSVQYKKFGIWHRMKSFDSYDEAEEFRRDQEYFDMIPRTSWRKGRPKMI